MRWQIGEHLFDEARQRLVANGAGRRLEPKASALLAYFCQHPGRDIGRDELLQTVWRGQVVSDNSINRVIVLLRKALGDEDKARRYIATIPKFGYRLIAPVAPLPEDAAPAAPVPFPVKRLAVLATLVLAALVAALALRAPAPSPAGDAPSIEPVSRLAATQSGGDLSADGRHLLYTVSDDRGRAVYVLTEGRAEPERVSPPDGEGDYARWAHGDEFFVYQFTTADRCEYRRVALADGVAQQSVLYECGRGDYTEFAFSPDNAKLYFVERPAGAAPYAAYELNLDGRTKRRLSQPVARGLGNHFVDVHPQTGRLLLLADRRPGRTSVYELDPARDNFALRRSFDYALQSAIWGETADTIVHPSMHPSYRLLATDLATGDSSVIVADSRRIAGPRRIGGDGRDYLFTSYLYNRDIAVSRAPEAPVNSTVMDYLPALSNDGERLAFVSKRAGHSQVLIKDFRDQSLVTLQPQDRGRRFFNLAWSPDDGRIVANTDAGVLVFDVAGTVQTHDLALPLPAYAVRWHEFHSLSYSHFEDGHWHAYRHRLADDEREALEERWAFSVRNDRQQISFDQNLNAFRDGIALPELSACAALLWRYDLRIALDGEAIYCHARDGERDLLRFDADMSVTRLTDAVARFEFYSVAGGELATTFVRSAHSDLMRTRRR